MQRFLNFTEKNNNNEFGENDESNSDGEGKSKKVRCFHRQRIREVWFKDERFKDWLTKIGNCGTKIYCRFCSTNINARISDILRHSKCKTNLSAAVPFSDKRQQIINFKAQIYIEKSKIEAYVSMYVACHQAIAPVDHLGKLININAKQDVALHRTKCAQIIKNVLSKHFENDLRSDIGENCFSILIDESNDIAANKILGVVIIYFSAKTEQIRSKFLGLMQLTSCNSESIVESIKFLFKRFGLNINKLIAIGTDNASVMIGVNNGVHAILRKELPNLILIKCTCHSLQLAISASSKKLPDDLEFLLRESYNWFCHSSVRLHNYRTLNKLINNDATRLKITQICNTRWSSRYIAVSKILSQWLELSTTFNIAKINCKTAEFLSKMYNEENKAYLIFLQLILKEVDHVNKSFQLKHADPSKLISDILNLIKSLIRKIVSAVDYEQIDIMSTNIENFVNYDSKLGCQFEAQLSSVAAEKQIIIRRTCIKFVKELINQLQSRLPENVNILQHLHVISIDQALLRGNNRADSSIIISLAKLFITDLNTLSLIECQWNNLLNITWNAKTTKQLWFEIGKYTDASGLNPFNDLYQIAIKLLSLPHSNGDVERIFSQVNLVKNKARNKLNLDTLEAILSIRFRLQRYNQCCFDYSIPDDIITKIGTMQAYNTDQPNEEFDFDIF